MRRIMLTALGLLAMASAGLAGTTRCLTYEEKILGRLHTVCADGTRAVSTYNRTLQRWETTLTPPSSNRWKIQPQPKDPRR